MSNENGLEPFTDKYGLVVTSTGDGGDACNRTALAAWCGLKSYYPALRKLQIRPGIWIRHPDFPWNDDTVGFAKWNISRDQLIPVIASYGMEPIHPDPNNPDDWLSPLYHFTVERLRFQNNDLMFPQHKAHFERQLFGSVKSYIISDMFLLIDVALCCFNTWRDVEFHDVVNRFILVIEANRRNPTRLSRISAWLLRSGLRLGIRGHLSAYFDPSTSAAPFMPLLEPIIKELEA